MTPDAPANDAPDNDPATGSTEDRVVATVHLVDASPYVFRAFHSLPQSIRDPSGAPANAVLGFAGFLLRLFEMERPTHLATCFDGSLTTSFRNEIFPDYKAHRDPPPSELEAQVPDCREMAEALGSATLIDDRYEADDLVATLVDRSRAAGARAVVVSSDKDLMQLVAADVEYLDFAREERYGPDEVRRKLGVPPHRVPDFLGLVGDSVDNIPGVRGIGPKTAVALLTELDGLEAILADLEAIEELPVRGARSVAAKLAEEREIAEMSKRLAVLSVEAPLGSLPGSPAGSEGEFDLERVRYDGPRWDRLDALCDRLGFERLRERVRAVFDPS